LVDLLALLLEVVVVIAEDGKGDDVGCFVEEGGVVEELGMGFRHLF
jgi:hypothetical protein